MSQQTRAPTAGLVDGVTGFEYGNTRLRARRSRILGDSEYRELFLAGTTERMLAVLGTTAYGPDVERALVHHDALRRLDEAVRGHLVRSLREMRGFYSGRAAEGVEVLLGRWDLRNLLAIVRSKVRPAAWADLETMLVPAGRLDATALAELAAQPSLRPTIELMVAWDIPSRQTARRLLREWPRYDTVGDPSVFEDALVFAWAESVGRSLLAWGGTALDTVMRAEIDQINLLAALRRRVDGAGNPLGDERVHLPGGTIGPPVLERVEHAPTPADVADALTDQRLAPDWTAALRDWTDDRDVSMLGGRIERAIARMAIGLFVRGEPLGIAIPVAFVWAKESEARNLRLLGRAIVHQLDWPDVEAELFPW